MARPATKEDLVKAANREFINLSEFLDSLTDEEREQDFNFSQDFLNKQKESHWTRDKNIKDVLIHLYEWQQLLLNWLQSNQNGVEMPFLPKPYNWKTYPEMNVEFWQKHQATSYQKAKQLFLNSHQRVMDAIDLFTDEALFTKSYFPWTGTTSLGSYCVSTTSSHYQWAIKKIKAYKKTLSFDQIATR